MALRRAQLIKGLALSPTSGFELNNDGLRMLALKFKKEKKKS